MSIAIESCSFTYPGTEVGVHDVTVSAGEGEFIALIGASGSGKTTILKLVAGFERPTRGKVFVCGRDMTGVPARKRDIGVVFQSYALFPLMTCVDNVAYPLKIRGMPRAERRRRAQEILDRVGLAEQGPRYPARLSGGQQQRVALARALVFKPSILLLDEPLSALDAGLRVDLRKQIRQLQRENRITTLHVTHDQEEALSMADKVALLDRGRVLQLGTPYELYDAPVSRKVADFVGQANLWNGEVADEGRVRVSFGDLDCDTGAHRPGDRVVVLVRPENIRLNPESCDEPNCVPGKVSLDIFLGALRRFEYTPDSGGGEIIQGETSDRGPIDKLYIPRDRIRLLPPEE